MKIAILGLGLMGASMAAALRGFRGAQIAGMDIDGSLWRKALERGWIDSGSDKAEDAVRDASLVLFCVYARHIPALLSDCLPFMRPRAVVSDICGVKSPLYAQLQGILPPTMDCIGLHPMAGKERGGFDNARSDLFQGCGCIVTPLAANHPDSLPLLLSLAEHIGAAEIRVTAPENHDRLIAYTSGLTHIAAAALCLNLPDGLEACYTGGAWRDGSRVADIDAVAWTDLITENAAATITQLDRHIEHLARFRDAIQSADKTALAALLQQAGDNKRRLTKS